MWKPEHRGYSSSFVSSQFERRTNKRIKTRKQNLAEAFKAKAEEGKSFENKSKELVEKN